MPDHVIICIAKKNAQVFQREQNNIIKWLNDHKLAKPPQQ